ncbi:MULTISPECIES: DUF7352 domain-containing protein [Paenibacillus]|uniref:DUF7352 domain-containing protein n=1 Tax=Paenibacillus brasilensis TaxID=128574 RepID=A0ABU0L6I8_9BACL|nr:MULTISPECIES: hypothetical protein [Paenibacillus]MDQ0496913.1 hypothetical protein [Paenibacillus brasilensis]WDM23490.1 hypothetical protein J4I02_08270 [Paenibacillus polymyxa]
MKTIYKYKLDGTEVQYIKLPFESEILSAAYVAGDVVVYALVDTKSEGEKFMEILAYGTGHEISKNISAHKFINTVTIPESGLVFHVFAKMIRSTNFF